MTFCASISQRDNSNIPFKISNLKIMYFKPCQAKDRFFTKYVLEVPNARVLPRYTRAARQTQGSVGLRLTGAR